MRRADFRDEHERSASNGASRKKQKPADEQTAPVVDEAQRALFEECDRVARGARLDRLSLREIDRIVRQTDDARPKKPKKSKKSRRTPPDLPW